MPDWESEQGGVRMKPRKCLKCGGVIEQGVGAMIILPVHYRYPRGDASSWLLAQLRFRPKEVSVHITSIRSEEMCRDCGAEYDGE